jgi:hypothetical protein
MTELHDQIRSSLKGYNCAIKGCENQPIGKVPNGLVYCREHWKEGP